jgi:hypothetical protein
VSSGAFTLVVHERTSQLDNEDILLDRESLLNSVTTICSCSFLAVRRAAAFGIQVFDCGDVHCEISCSRTTSFLSTIKPKEILAKRRDMG